MKLEERVEKFSKDHKEHLNNCPELFKNALEFLYDDCGLIYKTEDLYDEEDHWIYLKKMVNTDILCLYNAICDFDGSKYEALDVYCGFTGLFMGEDCDDKLQELINFVSLYENTASRLVNNHRDHYSHSVYVFILGLAIYHNNKGFQKAFALKYPCKNKKENIHRKFLKVWGMTALFHDIGYQYEIPMEQIKTRSSYQIKTADGEVIKKQVFFRYQNMDEFTDLKNYFEIKNYKNIDEMLKKLVERKPAGIETGILSDRTPEKIEDVLAHHIACMIQRTYDADYKTKVIKNTVLNPAGEDFTGTTEEFIAELLKAKPVPVETKKHEAFMDHAYYSAILLFKQLFEMFGADFLSDTDAFNDWMDTITAIAMHNKFFEFNLKNGRSMEQDEHPLAYLLILCDELQCWDRTSFGKASIKQLHAFDCDFKFDEGGVTAMYKFDSRSMEKGHGKAAITVENGAITEVKEGTLQKFYVEKSIEKEIAKNGYFTPECVKTEKDGKNWKIGSRDFPVNKDSKFVVGINEIVDVTGKSGIALEAGAEFADITRKGSETLSELSMVDLYEIAEQIYEDDAKSDGGEKAESFAKLNIFTKMIFINYVKAMTRSLQRIGCFYTSQPKAFGIRTSLKDFDEDKEKLRKDSMKFFENYYESHIFTLNIDEADNDQIVDIFLNVLIKRPGIEIYDLNK